jgi:ribose transport system ATP-binding protein
MGIPVTDNRDLLILSGISKRFGNTQALDDVSISFEPGTIHALVGENGAGKSTLVKSIAGIVQPDTGDISLRGEVMTFRTPADANRAGVHLVHQELALLPHRSVTENIFLGSEIRSMFGLKWRDMTKRASDAMARLGITMDVSRNAGELSTAQQQMIEIAKATSRESTVIILDEPTAALPPADAEKLFEILESLKRDGAVVIYISHRLDEVKRIADTVSVLKDGKHVATERAEDLTIEWMIELMVGRVIDDLYPAAGPGPGRDVALSVENLVDPPYVYGVSLSARVGEIVGIYGLEGHGQDELLDCIAGSRSPVFGRISVGNTVIDSSHVATMISKGVGLVPEDRKTEGLILPMDGTRNITIPILRRISKGWVVDRAQQEATATAAASEAGVHGDLASPVRSLSGGNQQKLLLSRWLAADSAIYLLNQPTRGVDVGSKSDIYTLIRSACSERGKAALVVSREIQELKGFCDRILVMSNGRIVAEHDPGDSEEQILTSAVSNMGVVHHA